MYIAPKIVTVNVNELNQHIKVAARSTGMCSGPSADYSVGAGCGYTYTNGGCDMSHNCDAGHY